jgi:tetratricopeptide (TPR) repeat protein
VRRFLAALDGRPLDVRKHALLALVRDYPASLDVLLLLERPLRDPDLASLRAPWLATLFSEHSDAPETWRFLAEDARRDGNLAGALAHLDRARSLRASPDAAVELLTVEVCLGLGLADRAAAALATLDARGLGTAPQRELLRARLAVAQGRPEAALTLLTHLLVDQPGNRDAMALQARVMADTGRWNEAREVYEQLYRLTGKRGYRVRAERLERLLTPKDDRRPRP